jgi:hypothetical protein
MCVDCTAPEEWRAVVGYEGWYSVSSRGRVRREISATSGKAGRCLAPCPQWHGYLLVDLYRNGQKRKFTVHSLVAGAFLGPRPPGYDINHIDLDKSNNRADNLEYVTRKQNLEHADKNGLTRRGSLNGLAKLTEDDVRTIRATPITHGVQMALARRYGVSHSVIRNVLSRKTWRHVS